MSENFNNPELRISSKILISIMILFLLSNYMLIEFNYQSLKKDYVGVLASITTKIIEIHPDMEKDIVPLMSKPISIEQKSAGINILRQYGLSEDLENVFFPYLNKTIVRTKIFSVLLFVIFTILLFGGNYIQYGYFYNKLRKFSNAAKRIVYGQYDLKLSEEKEGELSKLAVAFNSMGEVIRSNIFELKKDKQFLVDLLSDISHQLKTPLSSIILYNDLMISKNLSEEQRKTFLLSNQKQLERMKSLIFNILKLAKLDANAVMLEKEEQNLYETIEESMEILHGKASESKIDLKIIGDEKMCFSHDRMWLEEAMINIVKNAIEHSEGGGKVSIELTENPIYKRIIIADDGEGICDEDLPNIFKRFYKAKNSKKSSSIGIGLAIAKSIIEKHNGILEVESSIGKGTKFIATFLKY